MPMKRLLTLVLAAMLALSLTACGAQSETGSGYPGDDGTAQGGLNTVMHTEFFTFTITGAALHSTLDDYVPGLGQVVLAVDMEVENTFSETIPMFDTDFLLQWGNGEEDQAYCLLDTVADDQLPERYDLEKGQARSGRLYFAVPQDAEDFTLTYLERFDDGTTGDEFSVTFTADASGLPQAPQVPQVPDETPKSSSEEADAA